MFQGDGIAPSVLVTLSCLTLAPAPIPRPSARRASGDGPQCDPQAKASSRDFASLRPAIRPGIPGLWQISARNLSEFADRSRFDAEYWRGLSLAADLRILWRTIGVVLRSTGC